jgi:hypothetical protein
MKSFHQFINEIKTISYPAAWKHKVYHISKKGKTMIANIGAGRAVPINPGSGAGDGGGGNGGE